MFWDITNCVTVTQKRRVFMEDLLVAFNLHYSLLLHVQFNWKNRFYVLLAQFVFGFHGFTVRYVFGGIGCDDYYTCNVYE